MADDILKQIANDPKFKESLAIELEDFKTLSVINKATESHRLFIKYKQFEEAMNFSGKTILDLDIENETLIEKLSSYVEYIQDEINKKVNYKKLNSSNEDDNKRIRRRLQQTLLKAKAITDK